MTQILDELNGKWDTLSDAQQKALSNAIAGKTQSNVFNSLMSNWDTYKKMMSEFDQGMQFGSANKEMENQLTSIEGRLNSLKVNNNASYVQKCA